MPRGEVWHGKVVMTRIKLLSASSSCFRQPISESHDAITAENATKHFDNARASQFTRQQACLMAAGVWF
ncbi:hypothetical protein VFPPC_16551 [Pochonia chlamydosporia 170]|uniref:Uncharacterized protein n=1 Tax=Pochonia chlamydosporia 170 TaxID=1380566 RepID=A0A179F9J7_METCM|nr:hypothetical protein VFPPC_16551 [Pochonia chlamydosporia 170]OAQ61763.1 hypothetical protein VFPPC_16551 [Pochonia chlamydosporia 170]